MTLNAEIERDSRRSIVFWSMIFYYNDTKFLNRIIIQTLNNTDTEYYFEITDNKILMHMININLMALSDFYEIN